MEAGWAPKTVKSETASAPPRSHQPRSYSIRPFFFLKKKLRLLPSRTFTTDCLPPCLFSGVRNNDGCFFYLAVFGTLDPDFISQVIINLFSADHVQQQNDS